LVTEAAHGRDAFFRLPPQPHGGTKAEGADRALTTAYAQHSENWGRNPYTGAAWGTTDVNAVQAGLKHQA
jgi:hypothetical protein